MMQRLHLKMEKTLTVKLWDIRKKPVRKAAKVDEIFFAKVREGAVIPTKRDEDAAYDFLGFTRT